MRPDYYHLPEILRSFFNLGELRQFVGSLEEGQELMAHFPTNNASLADACETVASLLLRWGLSDADLLFRLHQCRPTRIRELVAFHQKRSSALTTQNKRSLSLEMTASIDGSAVGVYRLHPGQVKLIGRASAAEIQFPLDLVKLSRFHAWVSWPCCGPVIQDLDSKNGTWVNDRRVTTAPLDHDDQLRLGEIMLEIREPDRTETAVPTADDTLV